MESPDPCRFGDKPSSDVVVRLRTHDGRDEWLYCHSHILVEKSKYFADRLSENWPTCQILDSRNCVEVYCQESDFDHYVNLLRCLYVAMDGPSSDLWPGVTNAIGNLQAAVQLECPLIIEACVNYLEAVPWDEPEEEEILRIIPGLGSQVEPILARLQPVNASAIWRIFLSTIHFATSSPPSSMNDLKNMAQEQLEYMLTEDDDAPLLTANDVMKSMVQECMRGLLSRFNGVLEVLSCEHAESVSEDEQKQSFQSHLSDVSWACQILSRLEIMVELVHIWVNASDKIIQVVQQGNGEVMAMIEMKLKVIEVVTKVLEAIGYGTVILPTAKRLHMVKVWLPFVRAMRPLIDSATKNEEKGKELKMDGEMWVSLESAFVSLVLTLPSADQAEILTEWLENEHIHYPDFTEAFEVWCYRAKVAKRRLAGI